MGLPFGPESNPHLASTVDSFRSSFNVVDHMHVCFSLTAPTIPDCYTLLLPAASAYKRILLEGWSLVPTIADYNEFIPLTNPSIFALSRSGELPIVIDTGASYSITPIREDINDAFATPDKSSLGNLTSKDMAVLGQGRAKWDVEDYHRQRSSITI